MTKKSAEEYSEKEADRRFKEAIRRAVTTPHQPKPVKRKSKVVKDRQEKA